MRFRCLVPLLLSGTLLPSALAVTGDDGRARIQTTLDAERTRIERAIAGGATRWPVPADALDVVKAFGVPNDGQTPAAGPINRAIGEAAGHPLYFPPGTYRLEASLRPASSSRLYFAPNAEMQRAFDGGNGDEKGALIQGSPSFAIHDVLIVGGRWSNPGHTYAGRVLTAIGRNWTIEAVRVTSWGPMEKMSSCFNLAGENITVSNCILTGSMQRLNQDGIRVMCGLHIRVHDCYVESGDDAYCVFPPEVGKATLAGHDLSDVVFEHCYGFSGAARFLACGMTSAISLQIRKLSLADLNRCQVSDVHFVDCVGLSRANRDHAPAFIVLSANPNPGVRVEDVTFTRCIGASGPSATQAIFVAVSPNCQCAHLRFEGCQVFGGQKEPMTVSRFASDVRFVNCHANGKPVD